MLSGAVSVIDCRLPVWAFQVVGFSEHELKPFLTSNPRHEDGFDRKSPRPQKSIFSKSVRFLRKIYHSTRLSERFSTLFSDLKNLYAFRSYGQNTISIVDR